MSNRFNKKYRQYIVCANTILYNLIMLIKINTKYLMTNVFCNKKVPLYPLYHVNIEAYIMKETVKIEAMAKEARNT